MKTRHWLAGLTTLAAAALAGCGAATRTPADPVDGEPPPVEPDSVPDSDAATPAQPEPLPAPPDTNYGPAPEITNDVWLNVDAPIRLAEQRGNVVLVEFWTFG